MRKGMIRLCSALLLGLALVGGAITVGNLAGQPSVHQVADPHGGNGTGGGV